MSDTTDGPIRTATASTENSERDVLELPVSLRDYFAGQALAGILAGIDTGPVLTSARSAHPFSRLSYKIADAMLAERDK